MKICWDMLEGVHLTRSGTFGKGSETYVYKEACAKCGEPYLLQKRKQSEFCSISCAHSGQNHYMYGKTHTIETRKKLSKSSKRRAGALSSCWKGGVTKIGLTTYETYKDTLGLYEDIRKQDGTETLEVKCAYCGRWYAPTRTAANHRLMAINNLNKGEGRLYCSENCKLACPTYGKKMYPRGFKKATSREVSTYLRQMCFERDNWECQICGKTIKDIQLHCHHINGYAQNKMLANDIDNVITLCKDCHKKVHKLPGCRYVDLRCEEK